MPELEYFFFFHYLVISILSSVYNLLSADVRDILRWITQGPIYQYASISVIIGIESLCKSSRIKDWRRKSFLLTKSQLARNFPVK